MKPKKNELKFLSVIFQVLHFCSCRTNPASSTLCSLQWALNFEIHLTYMVFQYTILYFVFYFSVIDAFTTFIFTQVFRESFCLPIVAVKKVVRLNS